MHTAFATARMRCGVRGGIVNLTQKNLHISTVTGFQQPFQKWTCELPMNRAWSGRRGFEADLNRFALMPQVHRT